MTDQVLDGGEILTCTFTTMALLRQAVAAELGTAAEAVDAEAAEYGLADATPERDA